MAISTEAKVWTDEAFMALPKDGHRYELVDGEIQDMGNSGMEHGEIAAYLAGLLAIHVRQNKLGTSATLALHLRSSLATSALLMSPLWLNLACRE